MYADLWQPVHEVSLRKRSMNTPTAARLNVDTHKFYEVFEVQDRWAVDLT